MWNMKLNHKTHFDILFIQTKKNEQTEKKAKLLIIFI